VLLIDTREPPPPPPSGERERPPWEPNWRLWSWVALMIAALAVGDAAGGVAAYVLACAAIVFAGRAVAVAMPYTSGLRDYRQ
jgi:hypothetical protein